MDTTDCLYVILFCYGALFFFDRFFKSCSMYPYIQLLHNTGLQINFLTLSWHTTAFNRPILKFTNKYKKYLSLWFDIGVYLTILLLPISFGIVLYASYNLINSSTQKIVEPVIPGVTSPLNEVGYYVFALAISSCIHELGHAVAAIQEDIHLSDIGCNIYFIIPVTFVNIEDLSSLQVRRKLRVLCAGVWHNLMIGLISYLLFISIPVLLMPFYEFNGVVVTNVLPKSPVAGTKGLEIGDIITSINHHKVYNHESYIKSIFNKNKPGYCVETDFVHALDESVPTYHNSVGLIECCDASTGSNLCFEYIEFNNYVQLPPHMCLPVRKIIEHSKTLCYDTDCALNLHCIKPILQNTTNLMTIQTEQKLVIYIGHPSDVFKTIQVSEFIPKFSIIKSKWGEHVQLTLLYLTVFSFGLVLVNVVPCWYLDGQYIIVAVVQLFFGGDKSMKFWRDVVGLCATIFGTAFLVFVILGTVWIKLY